MFDSAEQAKANPIRNPEIPVLGAQSDSIGNPLGTSSTEDL